MKTQEQRDADRRLEEAILECVRAYDLLGGATLVDFIAVIEGMMPDDDGEMTEEYFGMAFRHGHCRTVVALGLLEKGAELLGLAGVRIEDE